MNVFKIYLTSDFFLIQGTTHKISVPWNILQENDSALTHDFMIL